MKIGLLDIGSNSIHLILVNIKKDLSFEVLDRAKEFTRLGQNTFIDGILSPESMQRGLATIKRFKKLADSREVTTLKAVATSAVREAKNNGDFIALIQKTTGIKVKVITGEEEARLIYLAVKHFTPLSKEPVLIVDIGGGSVEMILADEKGMIDCTSVKLGAARVKDEFFKKDPPTSKELVKLTKHIHQTINGFFKRNKKVHIKTVIGTSGTIITLASIAHWLKYSEPIGLINNYRVKASEIFKTHDLLISTEPKTRLKLKGLDPQRNEIIVPGSAVFTSILKKCGAKQIMLCEGALREGMIYDYLGKNRSKIEFESLSSDIRLRSILILARKCDYKPEHAGQVAKLALSLFDQTIKVHKLTAQERELLHFAALLHDIGYHISFNKHQKHTHYLIKNAELNGFEAREIDIIANVARYHTRSAPKKSHGNLAHLSLADKNIVYYLSAFLRIADALDRSHFGVVTGIKVAMKNNQYFLKISSKSDPELELWAAQKRKDLFEEVFGKKVVLITK